MPDTRIVGLPRKGGAMNLKVGRINALENGGVNAVKTLKFEKGGGAGLPPAPIVVSPLLPRTYEREYNN